VTHSFHSIPHALRHRLLTEELTELLDLVLAGEVVTDRATAERVVRLASAALSLNEQHTIDGRGRCGSCRKATTRGWRLPSRRAACSVYETLRANLTQPPQP